MGVGYTRQSAADIQTALAITAAPLNAEYNKLRDAFAATTGHSHDDATGNGPKISLTTSISGVLPVANGGFAGIHKVNGTVAPTANEDTGDGYAIGSIWLDTTADKAYIAIDVTLAAAIWQQISSTGIWQPLDATLTSLAAYNTNGILTQTAADTFTGRTIVAPAAGITVTNGSGVAGNPTLVLANDLGALEGLAANGIAVRTAADTWAQRTVIAPAAGITVTNGDGVAGNPTLVLANDLGALEGLASTGIAVRTGADAWAQRTITGTVNQVVVTDGDGVAGNPTLTLDATLIALGIYNTNGLITQTAADTFTGRTITGTANEITVTNGSGVAGNPTLSLPANGITAIISGFATAGGTANALTLTPTAPLTAYVTGQVITFRALSNSTTAVVTMNVSAVGIKNIRKIVAGADVAPTIGEIRDDMRYTAVYDAAADAAAGAWVLVGPPHTSDWVAYTPTFTGFGTVTAISIWSRRVGDSLHLRGKFTSGTPTAVEARMTLGHDGTNNNVTSDATKVASIQQAGVGVTTSTGSSNNRILIESNVGYVTFGNPYLAKVVATLIVVNATVFSLDAEIPITGW